ncbi:TIGR00153 family protein [Alloalcanivorax gelatiniphagus]|uniref:TIGR00153 family protein n=1 Tax=Alloalcanivorax gelatiniphagus TaxID=1194167 RepID=A0ABY2XJZ0_9GAMM|nr:TIGR00153 family protein [Alloalcanivorax gelatiniphagus]TMW11746.1 TIGR00153 family protein [Alloalcanivorax gelatiniphagus]|tara:strand:- start:798 stop:1478 length:681 start_codon:yes stop_codon:yes gene_type:complete
MSFGSSIAGLFGHSPIKPLQQHYDTVHECAVGLGDFFAAVSSGNWEQAKAARQRIADLENRADGMKKEFRLKLPKSLFLPVPRSDLLELVSVQDKVANKAKDIAGLMLGRQMTIPPALAGAMGDYLQGAIDTSAQAQKAINELDELVETGFSGREIRLVEDLIEELDRLERANDEQQIVIRAHLFKLESELPPVDVIFLYKIIDWIGDLADRAQKVGGRLQLLLAR